MSQPGARVESVVVALFLAGALAGGLAASVAGCGGDGIDSSPVPYERFCDRYATMACRIAVDCDCLGGVPASTCESYMRSDCADWVETPVNAGRMAYHADEGGKCLANMEAIARDRSLADAYWPESCDRMLTGVVQSGQACDGDEECLAGLACWNDQCVQMPGDGAACLDGTACAEGCFCGQDTLCHSYRAAGQPCPEGDTACDDGLYCDPRTTQCAPYIAQGGDCAHTPYDCADDLYCSDAAGQV